MHFKLIITLIEDNKTTDVVEAARWVSEEASVR